MQKKEYYNMYDAADYLWWYKSLRTVLVHFITRYVSKTDTILDAGCGTGENMVMLQSLGYNHLSGIDLSSDAVELSKKRGLQNVKKADITNIPFPDKKFNALYSTDVIVCLDKKGQEKTAKEFARVLKKDGIVLVHCAALEWLRSQHDVVVSARHRFTTNECVELFSPYFEVQKVSYRLFLLFPLLAFVKLIKKAGKDHAESDVGKPPVVVNTILFAIQSVEDFLIRFVNYPIGTSVLYIGRKK